MKIKTFRFLGNSQTTEEQAARSKRYQEDDCETSSSDNNKLTDIISSADFYKEDSIVNAFMLGKKVIDVKINVYRITSLQTHQTGRGENHPEAEMTSHRSIREVTILYEEI